MASFYIAGAHIEQAHEDDIWHSCWVPGQHTFFTGGSDEVISGWDAQTGDKTRQFDNNKQAITSIDINDEGTKLLSSSMDHKIRLWDIASEVSEGADLAIEAGAVNAWKACFVPNSQIIASSTDKGTVKLWSLETGDSCGELNVSRPHFLYSLAVSPDGARIACAGSGGFAYVFDVESERLVSTFSGHSDNVRSISFSPDSSTIITASDDKQIQLHDVRHGSPVATLLGHNGWVLSAQIHPSGSLIASGSVDSKVKIWDIAQRTCVETHSQHTGAVWSVAWQRSSKDAVATHPMLVSVGEDRSVQLYDPLLA